MNASQAQATTKSREIRIGLVMYGGVSLAIYINGVAREFFNAVRGRGAYKLLKAMTDSDIVVDIMSGTSAGGINGILLSYALCNNKEFGDCANLWRQHGDIGRLLRDPDAAPEQTYSLLDSEGYYQQCLEEAFAGMADCAASIPPEDCSDLDELDLYVTSTFADGRTYTVLDDAGHAIDVKDNRAVFVLKHRAGRKEPFNPVWQQAGVVTPPPEATHQALAKLGRMTSCFPVAFAPVQVKVRKESELTADSAAGDWADFKLQQWGELKKEAYFLDGGVLDNKPFTYTIKEIFHRTTEREVKRTLFYVDPDPENFKQTDGSPRQPNVVRAAMLGLVDIPGYQSIAEDLKLLAERNDKVKTYERLLGFLAKSDINAMSSHVSAATAQFIDRLSNEEGAATETLPQNRAAYENCRLIALSQRVVQGLLRTDGEDRKLDQDERCEAEKLFAKFDEKIPAGVKMKLLCDFDIDFRLRRLFHTIYSYAGKDQAESNQAANVFVLNRQLKLLEIVRNALERLIDEAPFQWQGRDAGDIWLAVAAAAGLLLDDSKQTLLPAGYPYEGKADPDWLNQAELDGFNDRMKVRLAEVKEAVGRGAVTPSPGRPSSNLLRATDRYEQLRVDEFAKQGGKAAADLKPRYDNFIYFDAQLFPLELFGDLREKDYIATVRMSPLDAQRGFSKLPAHDKTAGQALHHFAGFFKRSWRSNDILWGRLDAACLLLEHYFEPERISKIVLRQDLASALSKRIGIGGDLDPAGLFPNAPRETQDSLRASLQYLLSRPPAEPDQTAFDQMLESLIQATQLEILHEDLHKVLADANFEEELRNSCTAKDFIDPLSAMVRADVVAARQMSADEDKKAMQQMTAAIPPTQAPPAGPKQTSVGKFFADTYKDNNHGKFLDSVPLLDLLEILSTALLVLRNALLTAMGDQAKRVQAHALYAWLNRGLRLFHGVVLFVRRAPRTFLAIMFGLFAASAIALAVGITWRAEILYPNDQWQLRWLFAFIIVPGLIIATQGYWLIERSGWRRAIYAVVIVGTVAAVTFWRHEIGDWLADLFVRLAASLRA
jgi:patatin-related protein